MSTAVVAHTQTISAKVDGAPINFPNVQPFIAKGRVMVPLRGTFERMKATVEWDWISRCAIARRGPDCIRLPIDSLDATENGH